MKVFVVLPAYNAERTLKKTYEEIPSEFRKNLILVDDCSKDKTVEVAKDLGIDVIIRHERNMGYGANLKTCFTEAIKKGAEIIVVLHPDYQYDGKKIPELIQPVIDGSADVVLGSRFLEVDPRKGGMPLYKYIGNRFLTTIQNIVFRLNLSEYHTGLRAYKVELLKKIPFKKNSNWFLFDSQILAQAIALGARIKEISVEARYLPDSSTVSFSQSVLYGLGTLYVLLQFLLCKRRLVS
jgi:glycosyltransferase involved in cell wall biosynthesis